VSEENLSSDENREFVKIADLSEPWFMGQPGAVCRVAAIDPNTRARSTVWRIWTAKNTDDVYLAARPVVDTIKVSLHASGSWSAGFVSHDRARQYMLPGLRHMEIWPKPEPFLPGWRRADAIVLPGPELRPWPDTAAVPDDVAWVPLRDATRNALTIEIVLIDGDSDAVVRIPETFDLAALVLPSGAEVRIVLHENEWIEERRRWADAMRQMARVTGPQDLFNGKIECPRLGFYSETPERLHFVTELAAV
jgi:hypothetical protein